MCAGSQAALAAASMRAGFAGEIGNTAMPPAAVHVHPRDDPESVGNQQRAAFNASREAVAHPVECPDAAHIQCAAALRSVEMETDKFMLQFANWSIDGDDVPSDAAVDDGGAAGSYAGAQQEQPAIPPSPDDPRYFCCNTDVFIAWAERRIAAGVPHAPAWHAGALGRAPADLHGGPLLVYQMKCDGTEEMRDIELSGWHIAMRTAPHPLVDEVNASGTPTAHNTRRVERPAWPNVTGCHAKMDADRYRQIRYQQLVSPPEGVDGTMWAECNRAARIAHLVRFARANPRQLAGAPDAALPGSALRVDVLAAGVPCQTYSVANQFCRKLSLFQSQMIAHSRFSHLSINVLLDSRQMQKIADGEISIGSAQKYVETANQSILNTVSVMQDIIRFVDLHMVAFGNPPSVVLFENVLRLCSIENTRDDVVRVLLEPLAERGYHIAVHHDAGKADCSKFRFQPRDRVFVCATRMCSPRNIAEAAAAAAAASTVYSDPLGETVAAGRALAQRVSATNGMWTGVCHNCCFNTSRFYTNARMTPALAAGCELGEDPRAELPAAGAIGSGERLDMREMKTVTKTKAQAVCTKGFTLDLVPQLRGLATDAAVNGQMPFSSRFDRHSHKKRHPLRASGTGGRVESFCAKATLCRYSAQKTSCLSYISPYEEAPDEEMGVEYATPASGGAASQHSQHSQQQAAAAMSATLWGGKHATAENIFAAALGDATFPKVECVPDIPCVLGNPKTEKSISTRVLTSAREGIGNSAQTISAAKWLQPLFRPYRDALQGGAAV